MTLFEKMSEYAINQFENHIEDWVCEAECDFKLKEKGYNSEDIKKIMSFGYYTAIAEMKDLVMEN